MIKTKFSRVTLQAGTKYTVTLTPEASFDPALYAFPASTSCTAATVDAACLGLASDTVGAGTVESPSPYVLAGNRSAYLENKKRQHA